MSKFILLEMRYIGKCLSVFDLGSIIEIAIKSFEITEVGALKDTAN